jgi:hypothetical protein
MNFRYYYNPLEKSVNNFVSNQNNLEFDKQKHSEYVFNNKHLRKKIKHTANKNHVSEQALITVLLAIGNLSSGFCTYAGQKLIKEMTGIGIRTVKRAVSALRRGHIIITKHRYGRRRITSLTILSAYSNFMLWLKNKVHSVTATLDIPILSSSFNPETPLIHFTP